MNLCVPFWGGPLVWVKIWCKKQKNWSKAHSVWFVQTVGCWQFWKHYSVIIETDIYHNIVVLFGLQSGWGGVHVIKPALLCAFALLLICENCIWHILSSFLCMCDSGKLAAESVPIIRYWSRRRGRSWLYSQVCRGKRRIHDRLIK